MQFFSKVLVALLLNTHLNFFHFAEKVVNFDDPRTSVVLYLLDGNDVRQLICQPLWICEVLVTEEDTVVVQNDAILVHEPHHGTELMRVQLAHVFGRQVRIYALFQNVTCQHWLFVSFSHALFLQTEPVLNDPVSLRHFYVNEVLERENTSSGNNGKMQIAF